MERWPAGAWVLDCRRRGDGTTVTRRSVTMGSTSNMFGSDQNPAVPGGSISKPLIIGLLALLASRYFGGKSGEDAAQPTSAAGTAYPAAAIANQCLAGSRQHPRRTRRPHQAVPAEGPGRRRSTAGSIRAPTRTYPRAKSPMRSHATWSTSWRGAPAFRAIR